MERYYKINFLDGTHLIVKEYKNLGSLKLNLDRFTLLLNEDDEQVIVNTASITYIEEV